MGRPYHKTGQSFTCKNCGKEFYRTPGQIKLGSTKHCSKECMGKGQSGSGNPFWGKSHSEESRQKISRSKKGQILGNQHAKGYKHTDEARKRISEASKKMWKDYEKRCSFQTKGEKHHLYINPEIHLRRHRYNWTPSQKRLWIEDQCAYCGIKDDLVLDHIIPLFDGGYRGKDNCQTLCRACNLWKLWNVDLPRYRAIALAKKAT